MPKTEIVKVPFDGKRFKDLIECWDLTIKGIAAEVGCSDSTLRRAVKTGVINEVYAKKIAEYTTLPVDYFTGEKKDIYTKLARAVDGVNKAVAKVNTLLAEIELPEG